MVNYAEELENRMEQRKFNPFNLGDKNLLLNTLIYGKNISVYDDNQGAPFDEVFGWVLEYLIGNHLVLYFFIVMLDHDEGFKEGRLASFLIHEIKKMRQTDPKIPPLERKDERIPGVLEDYIHRFAMRWETYYKKSKDGKGVCWPDKNMIDRMNYFISHMSPVPGDGRDAYIEMVAETDPILGWWEDENGKKRDKKTNEILTSDGIQERVDEIVRDGKDFITNCDAMNMFIEELRKHAPTSEYVGVTRRVSIVRR